MCDFLEKNNIRTSNYGNICINDIYDYAFGVPKKDDKILSYLSPSLCCFGYKVFDDKKLKELCRVLTNLDKTELMNNTIYILSTEEKAAQNIYKIGKHLGSIDKLMGRYMTTLICPTLYLSKRVYNYDLIEKKILEELDKHRIINSQGNMSEWINIDLMTLKRTVIDNIKKHDKEFHIEIVKNDNSFFEDILRPKNREKITDFFVFNNHKLTIIYDEQNDIVWFSAKEIGRILGYKNIRISIHKNIKDKDRTIFENIRHLSVNTPKNTQKHAVYINESGMYALVFASKLNSAKSFKDWVTSEVLPSIRKHGKYELTLEQEQDYMNQNAKLLEIINEQKIIIDEQEAMLEFHCNEIDVLRNNIG